MQKSLMERKNIFENQQKTIYKSEKLIFEGVEGYTVYNTSVPFYYKNKQYIFGRIEKINEWASSKVCLFEKTLENTWKRFINFNNLLSAEDPFIEFIGNEIVLGCVFVEKNDGRVVNYYCKFYKGEDLFALKEFAQGPDNMKDIRLINLNNNKIGVFSRHRSDLIKDKFGSESVMGFTIIDNLNEINKDIILKADIINNFYGKDEWGGPNQAFLLNDRYVGIIGHEAFIDRENGYDKAVYVNTAYVFCLNTHTIISAEIIGTRNCYPEGMAKSIGLSDCVFSSGIIKGEGKKVLLFSGLNDCEAGYIEIEDPFEKYKNINFQEEVAI